MIVLEGLKQYSEFAAKHGPRRRYQKPFFAPEEVSSPPPRTSSPPLSSQVPYVNENIQKQPQYSEPVAPIIEPKIEYFEDVNKPSLKGNEIEKKLRNDSKEKKVPSSRTARAISFGGLGINLVAGALGELTKRTVGISESKNSGSFPGLILSEANALKIVDTLCRVRGAALKLGQMMSIQDSDYLSPELQAIFERVRQSADYMPVEQMNSVMEDQLGKDWKDKFDNFENIPFAAASIGQVHKASTRNGEEIAVKIQYPGVAESIGSDIKNVLMLLKYANVFPDGLFLDHIMSYAKKELSWEVDYVREAKCSSRYLELVKQYCDPKDNFYVPKVFPELSSSRVLTNELVSGIPIDKLDDYRETSRQDIKNSILERLLKLFFIELFQFNYMQTDPNWSNFLYDYENDRLSLIDFGSSREYSKDFVSKYYSVLKAAVDNDSEAILKTSLDIGFLSGYEAEAFKKAHVESVSIIGESIRTPGVFDFGSQSVSKRIQDLIPIMLKHRLQPPPEEIYSLHRKLSGLFLLCSKMGAQVRCRKIFEEATRDFKPL